MDFVKLQKELDALVAQTGKKTEEPAEKKMSVEDFGKYAQEQVAKAKTESEAGKTELAKKRLAALKVEVDKLQKYEFKAGELPNVVVYKDEEQLETTETEIAPTSSEPDGKSNYTAKAADFSKLLENAIKDLSSNRPQDRAAKKEGEEEEPVLADAWPEDLAKCVKKKPRDDDPDYSFGVDQR